MSRPPRRTAGHGQANKVWRWTGAAHWTHHDLGDVAACWMPFDLASSAPSSPTNKHGYADPAFTITRYISILGTGAATTVITNNWWPVVSSGLAGRDWSE